MLSTPSNLLIVGAGPYGLAIAAYAKKIGLDCEVVGRPYGLWKAGMPRGMLLRSASDWHIDPFAVHTLDAFLARSTPLSHAQSPDEALSREVFLDYLEWFRAAKRIEVREARVHRLERRGRRFSASLDDATDLRAAAVVIACGLGPFRHLPADLIERIPPGRVEHAGERVDFQPLRGKRLLLIGGGQTAFEWAALAAEAGAAAVHVAYRHATPRFAASDWSWVLPMADAEAAKPGAFRALSAAQKSAVHRRFHAEGRLKLEPWLEPRLDREEIELWPRHRLRQVFEAAAGSLEVELERAGVAAVVPEIDLVVLATGYRVDVARLPMLRPLLGDLAIEHGYPCLDEALQSSVENLFFTGPLAAPAAGPAFAFLAGAPAAARIIGRTLERSAARAAGSG